MKTEHIYCDHLIGWSDIDSDRIEFLWTSEIPVFALQRRTQVKSIMSQVQSRSVGVIRHYVDLLAMTDKQIIKSRFYRFKYCPYCAEELEKITAKPATGIAS